MSEENNTITLGNEKSFNHISRADRANSKAEVNTKENCDNSKDDKPKSELRRWSSLRSSVRPDLGKLRRSFRNVNCFITRAEEETPMVDIQERPRRRSIDINMGLMRRASQFLFIRKTVSTHPYHPFTPKQTTRKIYFITDEKSDKK